MGNGEYVLPGEITISGPAADKLLASGSGDAALLYIYILKNGGKLNTAVADKTLGMNGRAAGAAAELRAMGLITGGAPKPASAPEQPPAPTQAELRRLVKPADRLPDYTSEDVRRTVEKDSQFAALVNEVQNVLGNILTTNGLMELMGFYDYLGLPPDVILMLVAHCVGENEKKYGEGKRPTMRSIRSEAYRWAEKGVFSLETAEEYIKSSERTKRRKGEIRRMLGLNDRSLAPTEERYITGWAELDIDDELVKEAYDKTVMNTGKLAWKYMDTILRSWLQKGLKTLDEVREGDRKPGEEAAEAAAAGGGTTELERMKEYLKKLKQGGE